MLWIALLFALLLGCTLVLSFFSYFEFFYVPWPVWALAAFVLAAGVALSLYLILKKGKRKERGEASALQEKFKRFEAEYKQVLRGHLKVSILFWTFFYKKEKVKSFDDAKREVFQDLKKEFPHVKWMEDLLEEIRCDLIRYK